MDTAVASWGRSALNGATTGGWAFAAAAALGLPRADALLLAAHVGGAAFAMYAHDYLDGAVRGSDDDAKGERAAFLRAHAAATRAAILAAMAGSLGALAALGPGAGALAVIAVGMLLGFAYNSPLLPGRIAPKRAFTGAKVAYVALTWSLGCVALPAVIAAERAAALRPLAAAFGGDPAGACAAGAAGALGPAAQLFAGVAAFTASTVHNADIPDIAADRRAGVKTIAARVGRGRALAVSAALAAAGSALGLAGGAGWLAAVGPYSLAATAVIASGRDGVGVLMDDSQGMVAAALAALLLAP